MTENLSFALSVPDPIASASVVGGSAATSSSQLKFNELIKAFSERTHNIDAGEVLFSARDIPLHAFLLLKGVVRIGCKPNLQMVGPGAVLGLAEGLAQTPITFEVSAVSVLEVAEISIVDLERALGHSGKVLQAVARLAMERILHDRAFGGRS